MKVFKEIGSKERFVDMFQKVNKIKLNEAIGQNYNPNSVLDFAFSELKNKKLTIKHSNTQTNGDESFIELLCMDNEGNNIAFIFKTTSSEDDQEGVYNVNEVLMTNFSFDDANGEGTVELDENGLRQFNAQHGSEYFDIIDEYINIEDEPEVDEMYEDAVKLIDKVPYKAGSERMVTQAQYADEKPTNSAVRVKAPELQKFVQEDMNDNDVDYDEDMAREWFIKNYGHEPEDIDNAIHMYIKNYGHSPEEWQINKPNKFVKEDAIPGQKISTKDELKAYVEQRRAQGFKGLSTEDVPKLSGEALYGIAVRMADKMLPMGWDGLADVNSMWDYIRQNGGMTYDQLKVAVKRAVNARLKEEGYSLKDLGLGENMKLPITGAATSIAENDYGEDDIPSQEIKRFNQEIGTDDINTMDEPEDDNEPIEEIPEEEKKIILQAYDNLMAKNIKNPYYSPTTRDVSVEIRRITGQPAAKKNRVFPREAEPFLKEVSSTNAEDVASTYYEELTPELKEEIILKATEVVDELLGVQKFQISKEEYFNLIKRAGKIVYEHKLGIMNEEEKIKMSDYPRELGKEFSPEKQYTKKPKKYSKKIKIKEEDIKQNPLKDRIMNVNVDIEEKLNMLNDYVRKYKLTDGAMKNVDNIRQELIKIRDGNINEESPKTGEPNIEQLAKEKEEQGEVLQGGRGDGKSPLEFDPDQILKGLEVEMEHTDDPLISIEIVLDHLTEDPEYYTVKDSPEASAQQGAAADAETGNKHPLADVLDTDGSEEDLATKNMNAGGRMGINRAKTDDTEMTDVLLGYEPKNVGEGIQEEYGYEEYQGNVGDRYKDSEGNEFVVRNKVKGGVALKGQGGEKEIATGDLKFMKKLNEIKPVEETKEDELKQRDPATWHQIQIAKKTVKMPDAMVNVMGGMTKEEAREILAQRGIKVSEVYDFAKQEVDYANEDAYKKYLQYTQMELNNLTDDQKEEYFELWKQFKGTEK